MYNPEYKYSREDFWKIVEADPFRKYEYVDGYIRMMSRGSLAHSQIANNIGRLLGNALAEEECNVYNSDASVNLVGGPCYCPDVTVSCDPHDWTRRDALESPNVVVEVLSPTTERVDRGEKLVAYQYYPTILEILYVDSRKHHVEHYHRISQNKWETSYYERDEDIIDLAGIGVKISVRDIYLKVYLELEEARLAEE